jgi:predicted ArsR family transcriptional regulator
MLQFVITFIMGITVEQSSTKQKIILLLKKNELMTVAELSKQMGITPMAVRQHLMSLEKKNLIKYDVKKYGIGRPVFLYKLTETADSIFPKSYGKFISDILLAVEKLDGKKKVDKIFRARKERLLAETEKELAGCKTFSERVSKLSEHLEKGGYMVELTEADDKFLLKQFNCPLSGVPEEFNQTCKFEYELYRDLLGSDVKRQQCQREGDPSCTYLIPKPAI